MPRYLWLHPKSFSPKLKFHVQKYCKRAQLNPNNVFWTSIHKKYPDLWLKKGKQKHICNEGRRKDVIDNLRDYIKRLQPNVIIINDEATLGYITRTYTSLDTCRGSIYEFEGIPCVVVNSILTVIRAKFTDKKDDKDRVQKYNGWIFLNDLEKVKRWGEKQQRKEPKFNYFVAKTRDDLMDIHNYLAHPIILISDDTETSKGMISCAGFSFLFADGKIHSCCIPFINPLKENNCHWENETDEILAWELVNEVHNHPAYKVYQNANYDSAYYLKYNCPARTVLFDTAFLFQSLWCEALKRLGFMASICCDHYKYWKDENKGDKKDKDKSDRIPRTRDGLERYWRYNCLDTYWTLLVCLYLVKFFRGKNWAYKNYDILISLSNGPAFLMSMTGMRRNQERQKHKFKSWSNISDKALDNVRLMADDLNFNPESSVEFGSFLYDVLGAKPMKTKGKAKFGPKSVDKRILKHVRLQHPLFAKVIDEVWRVKENRNNASKYGQLYCPNDRFLYSVAPVTETTRFNGRNHFYWIGTNPQNIPGDVRDICVADPGYILIEPDYRQSDAWFVAFSSQDENYMRNISDDRDTHCVHAEQFYQIPYDKIYEAHLKEEEWAEHPTRGVRQNSKRIVHGINYWMMAFTLFMHMGREAVVATAQAWGHKEANLWSTERLVKEVCEKLIKMYFMMYSRLPIWFKELINEVIQNGGKYTNPYGFTRFFFGDIKNDQGVQREIAANVGQSGTAGNINRTLREIYYNSDLLSQGLMLLTQTHDSILFQILKEKLHVIHKVLDIMAVPCIINGRSFTVPVDCKVGLSWGKKSMMPWRSGLTYDEIEAHERQWQHLQYEKEAS